MGKSYVCVFDSTETFVAFLIACNIYIAISETKRGPRGTVLVSVDVTKGKVQEFESTAEVCGITIITK